MTEPHDHRAATLDPPSSPGITLETTSPTAVLITEPEVAFGTAAALPVLPTRTRWWIMTIAAALRRIFPTTTPRRRYFDDAVMAREMYRL
ncbi:hypothetical protein [Mycobacterium sp.]|jgi:hypothetical protein|uniref:hypothetical protein n=1 Tax=Mycobacterium sp. TaxID=1785 RepID=UPI002D3786E3|nr:hypothetical protein [Mycobacterium sp.]HZA11465.1 hypothetical protein [Mycobacterium sp.]